MTKERLNEIITGEEKPRFLTEREAIIIDKCLEIINDRELQIEILESEAKHEN